MNKIQIIILAAGKGLRMKSKKPKVLQELGGISLLQRILNTSKNLTTDISVIYGFGGEQLKKSIKDKVNWIHQTAQNGTGGALQVALSHIKPDKTTLILYGDVALISKKTLDILLTDNLFNLLTINLENPYGYGRIIRKNGKIIKIIEQKDANKNEFKVNEINTGIMAINGNLLHKYIPKLNNKNANNEFYLTDIIQMAVADNIKINTIQPFDKIEVIGVNDKFELSQLESNFQLKQAINFTKNGLNIIDIKRFDNRGHLKFGADCKVDINTIFSGKNTLGDNVIIGANCQITNSIIDNNVIILANSIIENSTIESNATIGPFARIRPDTVIKKNVKIGNFVETKKSLIRENSKINHLSYIGDSLIGKNVNIGAGVITCNYDGINKHQTIIEDNAFIGSNSALIAPVKIGKNAIIGAGSAISKNANTNKLTLTRAKQLSLKRSKPIKK